MVTDNVSIIIAPNFWQSEEGSNSWSGYNNSSWDIAEYGDASSVTGCTSVGSTDDACEDFNGKSNTAAILSNTTSPAAEYCAAYSNGYKGAGEWYLGSAGEMNEIFSNKNQITSAISAISGDNVITSDIDTWTSTQYSKMATRALYIYYNQSQSKVSLYWRDKSECMNVLPICQL